MNRAVACVEWGNYLGRGEEYVAKLRAGVARWLDGNYRFVCMRPNRSDMVGWWNKVALFEAGAFNRGERILFIDLDSVIVGPLAPLFDQTGIIHLHDWGWKQNDYCSSTMVWDEGEHRNAFEAFSAETPTQFRGDQDWLTHLGGWNRLPPMLCRSYRYHCKQNPPAGTSIVAFHGSPKPHEVGGWVAKAWRE